MLENMSIFHLESFITTHKLINPSQYGFHQNMSTCHALIDLIDGMTQSLDGKEYVIGVFIYRFLKTCYLRKFIGIHGPLTNVILMCIIFHVVSH